MAHQVDVNDRKVQDAWKSLTDDKSPVHWMLCGLVDGGSCSRLELIEASTGGFHDLKKKLKTIGGRVLFGCFVVSALDHRNSSVISKRSKLVSFSYLGSGVPELARAQSGFQKNSVNNQLFKGIHLALDLNSKDLEGSFTELKIAKRLHDNTAAHKPTHYCFFDKDMKELSVEEINKGEDQSDDEMD